MSSKKYSTGLFIVLGLILCLPIAGSAQDLLPEDNGIFSYHEPPRYRPSESHPLRSLAYITHPVGWLLREVIHRPISAFAGSTTFTRSFFGFREPFDFRDPYCFHDVDNIPDCRDVAPFYDDGPGDGFGGGADGDGSMSAAAGSQIFFPDVAFEFDKANLNDLGKGRVRQIAQLLASEPSVNVVLGGHADYLGSDQYNEKLSMRRADTVMRELSELGIDPARMSAAAYGESRPIFTEEEDWARAVNRRVEIQIGGAIGGVVEQIPSEEQARINSSSDEPMETAMITGLRDIER